MTLPKRFFLIFCGFIIFVILAPALVFAARGYYFDFHNRRLVKTGTLIVKTEPRGADVLANGKRLGATSLVKRFVRPGPYFLTVQKSGFRTWQKGVIVHEQRVTSLPRSGEKIFLFLETPEVKSDTPTTTITLLPEPPQPALDSAYFISPETNELLVKKETADTVPLLPNPLPKFTNHKIIVTEQKQIFLILDDLLYQVTNTLFKINSNVTYANWNEDDQALVYGNNHEIWIYQPLSKTSNELVTRISSNITSPAVLRNRIGYIFYATEGKIIALEHDDQGEPNQYALVETDNETVQFTINPDGDELTYLDSGSLIVLKVR